MACFRVHIPVGAKVDGVTADGRLTTVLPGEYVVHLLRSMIPKAKPLVRLVGADPSGCDVHVPVDVAGRFAAVGANDASRLRAAQAA